MLVKPETLLALECVPALPEDTFHTMLPKGSFPLYQFLKGVTIQLYACDTREYSINPEDNRLTPELARRVILPTLRGNAGGTRLVERLVLKDNVYVHQRLGLWKFYALDGTKVSFTVPQGNLYEVSVSPFMRTFVYATCHLHAAYIGGLRWAAAEPLTFTVSRVTRVSVAHAEML